MNAIKVIIAIIAILIVLSVVGNVLGFLGGLFLLALGSIVPLTIGGGIGYVIGRSSDRKQLNP